MKKLVVFLIASLFIFGCNQNNKEAVHVGIILPLSGPISMGGTRVLEGIELAIDDFNKHSDFKVQLVIEDSQGKPKEGVNAILKLINHDKIQFFIGDLTSGVTLAMAPIAEKNKVLLLAPGASNPNVRESGDYIFRNWVSDDFDGRIAASYIIDSLKKTSVYVLNIQNDYGIGLSKAFIETFKDKNGSIVGQESYLETQTDFKGIITKMKGSDFDVVYIAGQPKDIGYIVKQMKELVLNILIFSNVSVEEKDFREIVSELNTEIFYTSPAFNLNDTSKVIQNFVSAYKDKYGSIPDIASAHGYDAANIYLVCFKNNNSTVAEVKNCLYNIENFHGVTGNISFDEYGDALKDLNVKKINLQNETILLGNYKPSKISN